MISINSNPLASQLANQINNISNDLSTTSNRVATGKRIISAADDPAGIGILSSLKAEYSSYNAVQKNLSSGLSLLEVGASSLNQQQTLLTQMKDLATQASSDLLSADQRAALQNTFVELQGQLDDAVNKATIFGQNLTGATAADVTIQSGINAGDKTTLTGVDSSAFALGVDAVAVDLTDTTNASAAMTAIDAAVATVAGNQSIIGAQQNGLKAQTDNAKSVQLNLESSMSRIEDVDLAAETSKLAQLQAKQQLAIQMMGIVNQMPQYALGLLR